MDEALELAIHRALRGEVPPCVRAIVANLSREAIALRVFHYGQPSQLSDFQETVESELDQCLSGGLKKAPRLSYEFLPAENFEVFPGTLVVHDNPWAES